MSESPELPPKPEVAMALLQTALSVHVYLDPRPSDVRVPVGFKKQPQLVLQVGLNMAVPIPDLDVGADALSCTLSFNRRPEYCSIPWSAIYGLVGDDGRGMIWPDSVPPEVAASAEGRATSAKPKAKRRLHAVDSNEAASSADQAAAAETAAAETADAAPPAAGEPETAATPRKEPKAGRKAGSERGTKTRGRRAGVSPAAPPTEPEASQEPPAETRPGTGTSPRRQLPPYLRIVK